MKSSELLAFNAVWLGLQGWELLLAIRRQLTAAQFERLVMTAVAAVTAAVGGAVVVLTATGNEGLGHGVLEDQGLRGAGQEVCRMNSKGGVDTTMGLLPEGLRG